MTAPVLMIDNYDSFTFNLVQYLGELGADVVVRRNDEMTIDAIEAMQPLAVVISPGPKTPLEAGISVEVVRRLGPSLPILGVCLGHQCLGQAYGGVVSAAPVLMHGKVSEVFHDDSAIFRDLPNPFRATRYHSLVVDRRDVPRSLRVTAWTEDGTIMGLQHCEYLSFGVQFHPESILTEGGRTMLRNFLDEARRLVDCPNGRSQAAAVGADDGVGIRSAKN